MDIRNWPIDKVMQLPDWCFGSRFPVGVAARTAAGVITWDMSEVGLPERAVLWEVSFWCPEDYTQVDGFRMGLGRVLPTTQAEMTANTQLLKGCGRWVAGARHFNMFGAQTPAIRSMKVPFETAGQNLILEVDPAAAKTVEIIVITVWSAMPTEVPDWLVSGQANAL